MAQKYLLPCGQCDREIPVEVSQAGETVTCSCGAPARVPSMRDVRALPAAAAEPPDRAARKRSWHPIQGVMFGVGALMLLVFGSFATIVQVFRTSMDREEPPELRQQLAEHVAELEQANIEQAYDGWKINKALPLRKERPFEFVMMREWYRDLGWKMLAYLAGVVIGIVLLVGSLVVRPRRVEPPPPAP